VDSFDREELIELSEAEIKCENCESTKFVLMRTIPEQVALFCVECSSSSMLNADDLDGTPVITFMTEKGL
jgi:Zn finger protein HypA/HybF involved in hydrogenase expression